MKALTNKRSVIGEGPIWNCIEQKLYITNGVEKEILIYDIYKNEVEIKKTSTPCAAICFSEDNQMIVSSNQGVGILETDSTVSPICDTSKYKIENANDMKVGPDGRIYVGTQSGKRLCISNLIDGKLYSVDKYGNVKILLDGLSLSNGLDWSPNGKLFYHTDSDTEIIKEYFFYKTSGEIFPSGRKIHISGVDGFCVAENGDIYAACWGKSCIAVIDAVTLTVKDKLTVPAKIPASCAFAGGNMEFLAVTTATYNSDSTDKNAGLTFLFRSSVHGNLPHRF